MCSTPSCRTLIIPRLPRFERLALLQLQLYNEAQTMVQFFLCCNFKNTILIRAASGKDKVFCILHMLMIHDGLRKFGKKNVFNLHLKKTNPFGIHKTCIKIERSKLSFEEYIMALNQYKYYTEV